MVICFLPFSVNAEIKVFEHTVKQPFVGSQSPDDARIAAITRAKREVLEKSGTYLESTTVIKDGKLSKDQIMSLASGILKTEVVSQKNYMTKDGFGIIITVRVQIDTRQFERKAKRLLSDTGTMEDLSALNKRDNELLNKIKLLEEQYRNLEKSIDGKSNAEKKKQIATNFEQVSKSLNAVSLNEKMLTMVKKGKIENPQKALKVLDKAIELDPKYARSFNNRGNVYGQIKEYSKAVDDFNNAMELELNNRQKATILSNRGRVYGKLKEYAKALQDFRKAIEIRPDYALAYQNRASLYLKLKNNIKAMQDFNRAIELKADNAKAYAGRGVVHFRSKDYSEALQDFNKAIEINPDLAPAYMGRGMVYAKSEDYSEALQDFSKVIELKPDYAKAYNNRGITYMKMRLRSEGCADLKKACQLGECKGLSLANKKGGCNGSQRGANTPGGSCFVGTLLD